MAGAEPRFSIVTPLYNKARAVGRAIESALAQDYVDFELIVIDDGSTDDSLARARAYADSRIIIVEQTNRGAAAARNHGVRLARATHIAFLDADDAWLPRFLSAINDLIERFPAAGAYATGYFIKNPGRAIRPAGFRHVPREPGGGLIESYFRAIAHGSNPVWSSAVCLPRATLQRVGGFPEGVRLYEDLHLWSRIALDCRIAYCPQPLSIYYRDADNRACEDIVPERSDLAFAAVIEEAVASGRLSGEEARHARRFVNRYALLNAFKSLVAGRAVEARAMAREVRPGDAATALRRLLVSTLSRLPAPLTRLVWGAGRALKGLAAAGRSAVAGRGLRSN